MSIYGGNNDANDLILTESENEVLGNLIIAELAENLSEDDFNAFLESAECQALLEAGKFSKKTIVRMSKADDLERRTSMAALNLAKQADNAAWKEYVKAMKKAHAAKAKMLQQFGSKGARIAKKAQKEFQKIPNMKVTTAQFQNAQ